MIKKMHIIFLTLIIIIAYNVNCSSQLCTLPVDVSFSEARCKQYQCAEQLCSTDENACKKFIDWTHLLDKKIQFLQKLVDAYYHYIESIHECSSGQYVMLKSVVCQNKNKCHRHNKVKWIPVSMPKRCLCPFNYGFICENNFCLADKRQPTKKIIAIQVRGCQCHGKFQFNCRNGYCSVNKSACKLIFDDKRYTESILKVDACH